MLLVSSVCSVLSLFSLVTINRQTSYDSGILRQDYGIIRGLPMNDTRVADWYTIWVVHSQERMKWAGLITTPDQTVRAVHSCNSWFSIIFKRFIHYFGVIRIVETNFRFSDAGGSIPNLAS